MDEFDVLLVIVGVPVVVALGVWLALRFVV